MEKEVNYKIIREIQRAEKENISLTKLEENFVNLIREYLYELAERRSKAKNEKSIFSDELAEQLESEFSNAKKIILDMFERRERKIIMKALTNTRTGAKIVESDNLLKNELEIYNAIKTELENNREKNLKNLLIPKKIENKTEQKVLKTIKVKILEDIPSFVWDDEKTYGSYSKNEDADIQQDIAEFLIDNNKAVKNETTQKSEKVLPDVQKT
ncbi:MAG: DNA replication complex GINS family protein [Nanoarchaeota archaeon]|nr:DNA replication complex GINS family protein [Nanoarchaeota archaeon]